MCVCVNTIQDNKDQWLWQLANDDDESDEF